MNDNREKLAAKRFSREIAEKERDGRDSAVPIVRARSHRKLADCFPLVTRLGGHKAVTTILHLNEKRRFVKAKRLNCSPLCRGRHVTA